MSDEVPSADGVPGSDKDSTSRRVFIKTTAAVAAATAVGCSTDPPIVLTGDSGAPADSSVPDDSGTLDATPDAGDAGDGGPSTVVAPEATPELDEDFELGVASGDVTHEEAVLWARYDGSAPLTAALWEMDGEDYVRVAAEGAVAPASGGFVHVIVTGLEGGKRYRYAFFEMDGDERTGRSPVGRFRAALAPGQLENLIFGACSCTENGRPMDTILRAGERDDLDVFMLLGDTTYNDGAITREDHRGRWAENLGSDGYRALRESTSVIATWDDHEVEDNFNPESADLEAGREAFFENLPLRRDIAEPNRMWKSIRWGDTAEVFILDCRGERQRTTRGTTDIYISPAQMEWLKAALSASTAVFKVIVNSVPISAYPIAFDVALDDRWEGYPLQRDEILSHIDDGAISGVLWVSGDFHFASAQRVSPAGEIGATQIEILAGPGANDGNPAAYALGGEAQFDFLSLTNNYVAMELIPATSTIRISWIDRAGRAFEVHEYVV